jgi:replicative DNA helicase
MTEPARRKPAEAPGGAASTETLPFRAAPHNLEAEQALLGAILVNNEAHDRVSSFLEPGHFFDPLHQQIFETASKLIASGKQATPITLKTFFETTEPIDASFTVPQYLGRLAANAATIINARDYGRTIHDLATRRGLIVIGEDVVNAAYDSPVDFPPKEQIEEVETRLFALLDRGERGRESDFSAATDAATNFVRDAHHGKCRSLATGLKDLDAKMGGLQPSDLIIIAGRPGMGKSALATNIAFNVANVRARSLAQHPELRADDGSHDGAVVGIYSLEMSSEQVATRIICARAGVPLDRAIRGQLKDNELRVFEEAAAFVSDLPLVIDDSGGISIAQLAARARRLKRKKNIGLFVIDYLQLMAGTSKRAENRVQEITQITTGLKALAKELNVPILALSQLSRASEKRENNRPQLADLRDSGSIEQDADVVIFVYREEYYLERDRPNEENALDQWTSDMARAAGQAEAIIAKHRHGPTGLVKLQFNASLTRFSDLAFSGQSPGPRKV